VTTNGSMVRGNAALRCEESQTLPRCVEKIMLDFKIDQWDVRTLFEPEVALESGDKQPLWLWFFARHDEDLWYSRGVSIDADLSVAQKFIADFQDDHLLDILITYAGEPWHEIEVAPVVHAQMMRDLAHIVVSDYADKLRTMTTAQIRQLRAEEELLVRGRVNPN